MALRFRPLVIAAGVFGAALAAAFWCGRRAPRGAWAPEFALPARVGAAGHRRLIQNLRDFQWSTEGPVVRYRDEAVDLRAVNAVWLVVVPLSPGGRGPAHLMLSFGRADGPSIAISAEARRRVGEPYSPWRGLGRRYPLLYVVSTERDALAQRVRGRGQTVYRFPLRASPVAAQKIFDDMLNRAVALAEQPVFYNTVFNNCAQNIRRHVNGVTDRPFGRGWRFLLPGYLVEEVADRGLLGLEGPLDEIRGRCRVGPEDALLTPASPETDGAKVAL